MLEQLNNSNDQVEIVEVGPRDGLQNEKKIIPTDLKIEFIQNLDKCGFKRLEVTSFVSPKAIPQMSDHTELFGKVTDYDKAIVLVPNVRGIENAIKHNAKHVALFTATSNTFNQKNTNATIDEAKDRLREVAKLCRENSIKMRGYLSTVFGCPYEGDIDPSLVMDGIKFLFDIGCYEVSLGDTIGVANPIQVQEILRLVEKDHPLQKIALHFHDTFGMAMVNVLAGLERGVRVFDASAAGLGGCPYAKGATGNVATEDLWQLFDSIGLKSGIDFDQVVSASQNILNFLDRSNPSKPAQVLLKKKS
ncbi:hydroxymethylglutaryl-CoA lyase [Bacteriovoracaceae bacterium]|nr:hydroxymethylglutaryl-CoA lyase [Bacteriovoracaceae bacterium]